MNYPTKDTDLLDVPSTEETNHIATHCYYKLGGTERPTGAEQATEESDGPIAWLHDQPGRYEVLHEKVKALWMKSYPKQVEHYTIPLYQYVKRQPLSTEAARALLKTEIGIDPMLDGNVLKILRVIERAHGIGFNTADIASRVVAEAVDEFLESSINTVAK